MLWNSIPAQLARENKKFFYWSAEKGNAEIDFLFQYGREVIPVEVKAEENLRAKSLKTYANLFRPGISIRTSMSNYRKEDWLTNLPLYAISRICGVCATSLSGNSKVLKF